MADLSEIKLRLEEIKQKFNYTNEQLGELSGVSYNAIAKIIKGQTKDPSVSIFIDISQKLGVSIKWLLFNEGEMFEKRTDGTHSANDPTVFIKNQREKEGIYKLLLNTKDEEIETLKKMVRFLESRNDQLEKYMEDKVKSDTKAG
jgi:transcriptional regulator with XRE-family HTH domain